jgi:EAL domain-containing protein (putative c-di-GMP-specific phosphodiesterase class I)
LLEVMITLGRSLKLGIIAEGIETAADLGRLLHLGIAGQGYLFARPLSSGAAADFRRRAAADGGSVQLDSVAPIRV